MSYRLCALVLVCGSAALIAQVPTPSGRTGPTGTWQSDPPMFVTLALQAEGSSVTGVINTCSSVPFVPTEIEGGRVEGDRVTFKCTSADGDRTVSFVGRISGDTILFTWDLQVREGGASYGGLYDPFAPAVGRAIQPPRQFTARRIADEAGQTLKTRAAAVKRTRPSVTSVTFDRILRAQDEPQNWLTYSGNVLGHRHSRLTQITTANVDRLELAWLWPQARSAGRFQASPLVVDGILYTVQAPNDVVALDAATGRFLWMRRYEPHPAARSSASGGRLNRGLAIAGTTLFMGTLDAHLLAIDAASGDIRWNATVANVTDPSCQIPDSFAYCYNITHAPLIVKNSVIVGTGGGDTGTLGYGIRGFIAAYDITTGKEVWRFHTTPGPGEAGHDTWSDDSWKTGGAGVWMTGTYDPDLNLTFWGVGNPQPVDDGDGRLGDNLHSNSVVALDADTGKLRWHYQFTPHDTKDLDSAQVPVLIDVDWRGRPRKAMFFANKNGRLYVLDRATGELLLNRPLGETLPGPGTNWYPPSFSPSTGLFYVPVWDASGTAPGTRYGAITAYDTTTGQQRWQFRRNDAVFTSGILTTASDLAFGGVWGDNGSGAAAAALADGYFYALNARTGDLLWQTSLGGSVFGSPVTYMAAGKQYVAVAAGNTLFGLSVRR